MPYISATIIIQLLTAVWPKLSKLAREEGGRAKIIQYGRYLTVLICLGQGLYFASGWEHPANIFQGFQGQLVLIDNPSLWYLIQTVLVMTTGTMLLMWLGEQISDRGVGNGVSLVITIGIVARLPQCRAGVDGHVSSRRRRRIELSSDGHGHDAGAFAGRGDWRRHRRHAGAAENSRCNTRSAPSGAKCIPGGTSFMPLRVNYSGVMPIIFAQSILMFPGPVCEWLAERTLTMCRFCRISSVDWRMQLGYGSVFVHDGLCTDDFVLLVFLGGDAVQRNPDCRRFEEKRRLYSRACARGRGRAIICTRR